MRKTTTTADARSGVHAGDTDTSPIFERFPSLARLPRAKLGIFPSPTEHLGRDRSERELWIKRDDLNAPSYGGNKVRALEFLLGSVKRGDTILTMGGEGSTHVLVTAAMGARLGARTRAIRWRHEMNPAALRTAERAEELCVHLRTTRGPITAYIASLFARRGDVHWVPPGGSSAAGMLGHVNAALELASQVARGELPAPTRVVVPFGTGGTAAGIALGFAIAGLDTTVVAARVVPGIVASRRRLHTLTSACAALIARHERCDLPTLRPDRFEIVNDVYGGAYGRALPTATAAAERLHSTTGISLDDSYSAKAWLAALRLPPGGPILFWLTYGGGGGELHEVSDER